MTRCVLWILMAALLLFAASPALGRKWTDSTGRFSIEAELIEVKDGRARLRKIDGAVVAIPLSRLCKADRDSLESLEKDGEEAEPVKMTREEAVAEIKRLGGDYSVAKKSPGMPVVEVSLSNTKVTDAGLALLRGFIKLQELDLSDTRITDKGLEHLKKLTGLQDLSFNGSSRITDAGLVYLRALVNLQILGLGDTKVSDAGLLLLKGCAKLRKLDLSDTEVTDEGVGKLQETLPNCQIAR